MNTHVDFAEKIAQRVAELLRADVPVYLTAEQAAAYTGIALRTLAGWRSKRKFAGPAFIREGKMVRYARKDLDEWMAARTVRPT